ncbi:hypothetical protein [Streptomyces sp. SPB162]|uniref:hypothetical protein n=1 Tax=Streptomyces sp. SPB162 TaxID=2940560 RepID=UPI002406AA9A|nr:hypothetical protein [Streptomyces sp. SPB162]
MSARDTGSGRPPLLAPLAARRAATLAPIGAGADSCSGMSGRQTVGAGPSTREEFGKASHDEFGTASHDEFGTASHEEFGTASQSDCCGSRAPP